MILLVIFNSKNFKHVTIGTYYYLLQLMTTSPIYFTFKPQLNWHSASLFSAYSLITVILAICSMAQSKVNWKLANLGVSQTNTDMNKAYATQSKSRTKLTLHGACKTTHYLHRS